MCTCSSPDLGKGSVFEGTSPKDGVKKHALKFLLYTYIVCFRCLGFPHISNFPLPRGAQEKGRVILENSCGLVTSLFIYKGVNRAHSLCLLL